MADRKDIELRIRATDTTKQNLGAVADSIKQISDALGQQVEAAKRGDESIDGLKQSLKALGNAGAELLREQSLIDQFNRQAEAVENAQKKVTEATSKYERLKAEVGAVAEPTQKLQKAFEASERAMTRSQTSLEKMEGALATTAGKLEQSGIEVVNLAAAQQKLVDQANAVGTSMRSAQEALDGYGEALKRSRQAAAEKAATDKIAAEAADEVRKADEKAAQAARDFADAETRAAQKHGEGFDKATAVAREDATRRLWEQLLKEKEAADAAREAEVNLAHAEYNASVEAYAAMQRTKRGMEEADMSKFWEEQITFLDQWDEALRQNRAIDDKAARDLAAFKKIADGAAMASNGLRTFAQASNTQSGVAAGLTQIVAPAEAARASLDTLDKHIAALSVTASRGKQETTDYSGSVRNLQAAMKTLVGTGESIDAFRQQTAAVRASREAFTAAREDVKRYADAIRNAGAPDQSLAEGLRRAQAALAAAQREMQRNVESARVMRAALQQAGVATNDLAGTEARLVTMAQQARVALDQLNAAYRTNGQAASGAAEQAKKMGEGSRESLSWYQRVRGELIALATAYVGVQGAIGLATGAITAFVEKQAVQNRLGIVLGTPDQKAIGNEYTYVHQQAERLGIGINELADSYSRFALSSKNANMNLDQTKYAFERITEVMRVNHASSEAVNGAFYQLEQMLSKNKIQMDDLRQASNWIPGLEGMLAKGLGMVSVKQLFDAMKKGTVDAKTAVLALGEEMERQYAKQIPEALKSLQAEQGRFNTSLYDFKLLIAESGFADAYTTLLQRISAFFRSADGEKFAHDLSDAFSGITKVIVMLVENLDAVKTIIGAIIGLKLITFLGEAATAVDLWTAGMIRAANAQTVVAATATEAAIAETSLGIAAGGTATAVEVASSRMVTAVGLISKGFQLLTAAVIGWEIGKYLDDKIPSVHKFATYIAEDLAWAWDRVMLGLSHLFDVIVARFKDLPTIVGNAAKEAAATVLEDPTGAGPLSSVAQQIRASKTTLPPLDPKLQLDFERQLAAINARHEANMKSIGVHGGYTNDGKPLSPEEQATQSASDRAKDPRGYKAQADLVDLLKTKEEQLNAIIDERAKKIQAITDKRGTPGYNEAAAEKEAEAIVKAYGPKIKSFAATTQKELQPLIDSVGFKAPAQLQDFRSRLAAATGRYDPNLEATEKKPKGDPIGTMDRSLQNELETLLARVDRSTVGTFEERLKGSAAAIEEQYSQIFRKLEQYQKIGGKTVGGDSIEAVKVQVKAAEDQLKAAAALKLELAEITKNEQLATDIVKQRTDAYKEIEDQVASGKLSPVDGMERAKTEAVEFNKQLTMAVEKAIQFNETMRGKPGVNNEKLDQANSALRRMLTEGSDDGGKALRGVAANLDKNAETSINDILKERNDLTQSYANLVKLGLMTNADAQKQLQADYARTNGPLNEAIDNYEKLIESQKQFMKAGDYELAIAKIKTFRSEVAYLNPDLVKLKNTVEESFTKGFTDAFDKSAESLANLIDGTHNLGDTFKDLKNIVLDFFAQFLKNIANAVVQIEAMRIAQSITSSSGNGSVLGGLFGAVANAFAGGETAAVSHAGSVVGMGHAMTRRAVDWRVFQNAPRYHNGSNGPLGLRADEQATILQRGEVVQTAAQAAAAKRQSAGGKVQAVPVKQVLAIGDNEVASAMAGTAGEDTTLTHIRRNAETVKQWLK